MRLSISEVTTAAASFEADLCSYRAAGVEGIGIWEVKLPADDVAGRALLRGSGLAATHCVPAVPTILPSAAAAAPTDPSERLALMMASVTRLAGYEPAAIVCLTGPRGRRDEAEARTLVVDALRALGDAAGAAGVPLGLEPVHPSQHDAFSFVNDIPAALELLEEAGHSSLGIMFDTYHLWDSPALEDDIAASASRFVGVHVADWREPPRSGGDRLLPGDGVIDLPRLLGALDRSGYDGWYDVEIFSDEALADSLWKLEPGELARRARESFERVWEARER